MNIKNLFSRTEEGVSFYERLTLKKANDFDNRHPYIINTILIIEAIIFFSVVFLEL